MTKPIAALIVMLLLAACGADSALCPSDPPRVQIAEDSRTLNPGQTFKPTMTVLVCGGSQSTAFVGFWQSADREVVSVDSLSGLVTAVGTGSAYVFARYQSAAMPSPGTYDSVLIAVP